MSVSVCTVDGLSCPTRITHFCLQRQFTWVMGTCHIPIQLVALVVESRISPGPPMQSARLKANSGIIRQVAASPNSILWRSEKENLPCTLRASAVLNHCVWCRSSQNRISPEITERSYSRLACQRDIAIQHDTPDAT